MKKVAVLLTVHNRREKTLACLENCYRQIDSMKGDDTYSFSVYLVDDGSTDGTSEAVLQTYPQTHVIKGDGSLFWNHGMRTAWDAAAADEQDFYLWLNDDTLMKEGALSCIMETSEFLRHKSIVVGTTGCKRKIELWRADQIGEARDAGPCHSCSVSDFQWQHCPCSVSCLSDSRESGSSLQS